MQGNISSHFMRTTFCKANKNCVVETFLLIPPRPPAKMSLQLRHCYRIVLGARGLRNYVISSIFGDIYPLKYHRRCHPWYLDIFRETMSEVYYPEKILSLDESMVLWRGRLLFKQFIPNIRRFKLYMLTEPCGLVLDCLIYCGAKDK